MPKAFIKSGSFVMTGLGRAPICQKPVRMHRVVLGAASRFGILRLVSLALISTVMSSLVSCGIAQNKIQASRSGSEATSISKITPIAAKPNEVVSLTGSNFYTEKNLKVSLDLANGERASVPLVITDTKTASFTMPGGAGLGVKDVTLTQGTAQMEVTKFNLIADQVENQLPIVVGDGSTVCSDQQYIDRNGDRQTGTKDCSAGGAAPICAADGVVGCVTTNLFKSVDMSRVLSGNIKSGITIASVPGAVTPSPSNCASDGDVGCVVVGPSFAAAATAGAESKILFGQSVGGVPGNVTLPAEGKVLTSTQYGVGGTGSTGTLTLPLASNVLSGSGTYGDPGALMTPALADRGTWNLTTSFPGAGYYAGVSNSPTAPTIATGTTIAGVEGSATLSPANCSSNGQQSCVAAGSYFAGTNCAANGSGCYLPTYALTTQPLRAIDYDNINSNAARIRTSTTLGGVTGTLADCSTNGSSGCVATSTYLAGQNRSSWDMTTSFPGAGYYSGTSNTPTVGDIKSGVSIAGVTGQYPSSSFPLTGSSGADLTTATFDAQIKSSGTFQYFGSGGVRYTGTGDTDITAANIGSGVNIFGTTGNVTAGASPNAWDLRAGVTVGSVTGQLKVNCRNRVNSTIFNYDGAIGSIGQTGVTSGSAIDIWDTIDDRNNNVSGLPPSIVTAWGSNTDCGGVESAAGDDNVWKDVTTTSGGAASNCATDADRCTMQDKITGLWWSKLQSSGAWNTAWNTCQTTLNASGGYNGQTGWRLPTQKELMEAYTHGIRSAARTNWMTEANMNANFWSGSSVSYNSGHAWNVTLANGYTGNNPKNFTFQVVCVR
jgi:hypothetical protein